MNEPESPPAGHHLSNPIMPGMARFAEVIAIGDEMTSGAKLDTNTQWLCQRLGDLGLVVRCTAMVGDDIDANVDVFRQAVRRSDVIVSTGGLGPTADDLTRECLSIVANKPLAIDEASLAHIESLFASRDREMPPKNIVQAMFPEGSQVVFNPRGTAPGIDVIVPRFDATTSRIFALPGVPAEMKEMFANDVSPRITVMMGPGQPLIRNAVIKCFGLGESEMESRLGEMISRLSYPRVGITVSAATISLRITAMGNSAAECDRAIDSVRQEIHRCAGDFVFGEGEHFELQHAVAEILAAHHLTLATLEKGRAAPLAGWFSALPVASPLTPTTASIYVGGVSTGVGKGPSISEQTVRETFGADLVLVVDAYPDLGCMTDAPEEVTIAIYGAYGANRTASYHRKTFRLGGHPSIVHSRIAKAALSFLRHELQSQLAGTTHPHPPHQVVST